MCVVIICQLLLFTTLISMVFVVLVVIVFVNYFPYHSLSFIKHHWYLFVIVIVIIIALFGLIIPYSHLLTSTPTPIHYFITSFTITILF